MKFLDKVYVVLYKILHKKVIHRTFNKDYIWNKKPDKKFCAGCIRKSDDCHYFENSVFVVKDVYFDLFKLQPQRMKTLNCFIPKHKKKK